jgi:hypothetical protein
MIGAALVPGVFAGDVKLPLRRGHAFTSRRKLLLDCTKGREAFPSRVWGLAIAAPRFYLYQDKDAIKGNLFVTFMNVSAYSDSQASRASRSEGHRKPTSLKVSSAHASASAHALQALRFWMEL